jgi:hypothetical protein
MKLELVGGPLDGSFVDESELPPEGIRTTFYATRGDGTADAYRLHRIESVPTPPAEFVYEGLVPWSTLSDDTYPTD